MPDNLHFKIRLKRGPMFTLDTEATIPMTGVVHQNPPHGLGHRAKKVAPILQIGEASLVHQPQRCFVNQRGRLQGMLPPLARHQRGSQRAKFRVNKLDQIRPGTWIARLDAVEGFGHVPGGFFHGRRSHRTQSS